MLKSSLLSSVLFALTASLPSTVTGAAVERAVSRENHITLDIVNAKVSPDGFVRNAITANGTYPGPVLTATKGDTLVVQVNNRLTDPTMRRSTSIDFDGIFVTTSNAYNEGSPGVTACAFGPNTSYTYTLPLGNQTGTFWYHSQLSVQYVDGLRGALIVYDPDDPLQSLYDVDDESTILSVGDWWHNSSVALLTGYVATGIVPVSDTGTVNGVGRFNGGPEVPFAVMEVEQGKRYRIRLINMSARNVFTMSFDDHDVVLIETDGVATQPMQINEVLVLAGQRYSLVLTADQPVANYWINAPYTGGTPANNLNQNATLSRAILRYKGAPDEEPLTPLTLGPANPNALVEANLRPLIPENPGAPDVNLTLNLVVTAGKAQWNVNNVSYLSPEVPTLVKILNGANSSSDFNITENTFILPKNAVIQVDFPPNDDDEAHPFHLHGNNFFLIKSNSSDEVNTIDPIRRDVSGVGAAGMTVRFKTDNPGPWFFHCHIFWHFQAGLATVMASGLDAIREEVHPTAAWERLCPAYDALPADEQ